MRRLDEEEEVEAPAKLPGASLAERAGSCDWLLLRESSLGIGDGGMTVTLGFIDDESECWLARLSGWVSAGAGAVVTGWAMVGTEMEMEGLREWGEEDVELVRVRS